MLARGRESEGKEKLSLILTQWDNYNEQVDAETKIILNSKTKEEAGHQGGWGG